MPHIIANTYEVIREIGSGGGGIVYLGRHQRLNKLIVIKEDKRLHDEKLRRRLTEEMLRREVDALKNLSHTYIPQVYDYVQEDGKVYTVMDYIEGESLDKLLEHSEEIPQSKVVEWACELLDALCYLHSRPPHGILHSDIKPPNIMITPQGDIRLIDFNIALALGEEGAVRVGFSRGYASPEHYGTDFTVGGTRTTTDGATGGGTRRESTRNRRDADTGTGRGAGTGGASPSTGVPILNSSAAARTGSQSTSSGRTVLLDVRSDIYSLGATLYHVLAGERPAENVLEVKPLSSFSNRHISPAVAAIITKAMEPNPDRRYQTAQEMLTAFEQLHSRDPRARRRRRHMVLAACLTILVALAGGAISYVGLRQSQREEQALVLCAQSREALDAGDVDKALDLALSAIPAEPGLLDPPTPPEVQRAMANALGVYDLSDGYKPHRILPLPASPIKINLSQAGTRAAALADEAVFVFDTETGEELVALEAEPSALSDFLFRDANTLLYAGTNGLTAWDLTENRELWHTGTPATAVALSGDSRIAASAYRDADTAFLWDARTGEALGTIDFGEKKMPVLPNDVFADRKDNLFTLDETGEHLTVSFTDGSLRVFPADGGESIEVFATSDYLHFDGGFHGNFFAAAASAEKKTAFAIWDLTYPDEPLIEAEGQRPYHVQADQQGVLFSAESNIVELNPYAETAEEVQRGEAAHLHTEVASFQRVGPRLLVIGTDDSYTMFDDNARMITTLTSSRRIDFALFGGDYLVLANRDAPSLEVRKWERTQPLFRYDADFEHMEARIHSDGTTALLYGYGPLLVTDPAGQTVAKARVKNHNQAYDYQYRRPGDTDFLGRTVDADTLEILYTDGTVLRYDPKTGEALAEERTDAPDLGMYEEFETEHYRVTNPIHETPQVYDRDGHLLGELEAEGELAYVTEWGGYLITEYLALDGQRYARLLDSSLRTLADLPDLCDVLPTDGRRPDGTLVFDDRTGSLRETHIRTLDELVELARERGSQR